MNLLPPVCQNLKTFHRKISHATVEEISLSNLPPLRPDQDERFG